jgi:hypothetical protein
MSSLGIRFRGVFQCARVIAPTQVHTQNQKPKVICKRK